MSAFPYFSNIAPHVNEELNRRKADMLYVSRLNCWVRLSSGVGTGCMIYSNPSYPLFKAAGSTGVSIYGNNESSGTVGVRWDGKSAVSATGEYWGFRPPPVISSIEIDEGAGSLSRKAEFTITAYTVGQLNTLCKFFLEPGYTIFLEFGWNTPDGVRGYEPTLSANGVGRYQSFGFTHEIRKATKGHYDNYLGFITGGSVAMNGDTWTLNVKCTGFTELPAFLNVADNSEAVAENEKPKGQYFKPTAVNAEQDLGRKRFMMAFNKLPSNKQSGRIANLINDKTVADIRNFVNVDEYVKEAINDTTSGTEILGFSINDEEIKSENKEFEVPSGTKLIGDESFIRFGTLMKIINTIGVDGFRVGETIVKNYVNTDNTVCSAFKKIFSTDKTKLLIPNGEMPFFSVFDARQSTEPQTEFKNVSKNNIEDIHFPSPKAIENGVAGGKSVQYVGSDINGISKPAYQWGFLNDLYVNMDFAKGILETKNFLIKDALFQILNGMSSAAGGVWDFQIQESSIPGGGSTELTVVDMNFIPRQGPGMTVLDATGIGSVFIDANLDLDISGAKMNQVIAKRLNYTANSSSSPVDIDGKLGLFTDEKDMVLQSMNRNNGKTTAVQTKTGTAPTTSTAQQLAAAGDVAAATKMAAAVQATKNTAQPAPAEQKSFMDSVWGTIRNAGAAGVDFVQAVAYDVVGQDAKAAENYSEANRNVAELKEDAAVVKAKTEEAAEKVYEKTLKPYVDQLKAYLDREEAKEKNFQNFLDKLGAYPKVALVPTSTIAGAQLEDICYLVCYNDQLAFESIKNGHDKLLKNASTTVSALMPIKFTFTVHGVSGIKRGDKFKINGIPTQYQNNGFFQVTAVKQIIEGQMWKTEVEGQFRLSK